MSLQSLVKKLPPRPLALVPALILASSIVIVAPSTRWQHHNAQLILFGHRGQVETKLQHLQRPFVVSLSLGVTPIPFGAYHNATIQLRKKRLYMYRCIKLLLQFLVTDITVNIIISQKKIMNDVNKICNQKRTSLAKVNNVFRGSHDIYYVLDKN